MDGIWVPSLNFFLSIDDLHFTYKLQIIHHKSDPVQHIMQSNKGFYGLPMISSGPQALLHASSDWKRLAVFPHPP